MIVLFFKMVSLGHFVKFFAKLFSINIQFLIDVGC